MSHNLEVTQPNFRHSQIKLSLKSENFATEFTTIYICKETSTLYQCVKKSIQISVLKWPINQNTVFILTSGLIFTKGDNQWLCGHNFALFWPPPTSKWTLLALIVDKNWHFLDHLPPLFVHVVIERPLKGRIIRSWFLNLTVL